MLYPENFPKHSILPVENRVSNEARSIKAEPPYTMRLGAYHLRELKRSEIYRQSNPSLLNAHQEYSFTIQQPDGIAQKIDCKTSAWMGRRPTDGSYSPPNLGPTFFDQKTTLHCKSRLSSAPSVDYWEMLLQRPRGDHLLVGWLRANKIDIQLTQLGKARPSASDDLHYFKALANSPFGQRMREDLTEHDRFHVEGSGVLFADADGYIASISTVGPGEFRFVPKLHPTVADVLLGSSFALLLYRFIDNEQR